MATTIPGTNCITERQDRIINTLSQMQTFQAFARVNTVEAARDHILVGALPDPDPAAQSKETYSDSAWIAMFPLVVIGTPEDGGVLYEHATGDGDQWGYSKSFVNALLFQRFRESTESHWQDALRNMENEVGNVIDELAVQRADRNVGASTVTTNENAGFTRYQNVPLEPMSWEWRLEADNRVS